MVLVVGVYLPVIPYDEEYRNLSLNTMLAQVNLRTFFPANFKLFLKKIVCFDSIYSIFRHAITSMTLNHVVKCP